jgi:hypothetical protein
MLGDPFLQSRYLRRLERQIELPKGSRPHPIRAAVSTSGAHVPRLVFRVHEAFENRYERISGTSLDFRSGGWNYCHGTTGIFHCFLSTKRQRNPDQVGVVQHRQVFTATERSGFLSADTFQTWMFC